MRIRKEKRKREKRVKREEEDEVNNGRRTVTGRMTVRYGTVR